MTRFITIAFVALSALQAFAAQTLQFNTSAGRATNFANAAGTPSSGLRWGLVIDTAGDGFDTELTSLNYDIFTEPTTATQLLQISGVNTDDVFVPSANLSLDSSGFGVSGGPGTFGNVAVTYSDGIAAGQKFAFLWLNDDTADQAGVDTYGFFNVFAFNNSAVMPADAGGTTNFGAIFSGSEPIRSANTTFGSTVIPEPSRVAFFALGLLGFLARRRR